MLTDSQFKLTYCKNCNENKAYFARKGSFCSRCKSALLYKCGRCMRIYQRIDSLQKHLRLECDKKPNFFCDDCNYKAHQKSSLVIHINTKHLPRDPNLNKCVKCEKNFSDRSNLRKHSKICGLPPHLRRLSRPVRFFCSHCDYSTAYNRNLKKHIQSKHIIIKTLSE